MHSVHVPGPVWALLAVIGLLASFLHGINSSDGAAAAASAAGAASAAAAAYAASCAGSCAQVACAVPRAR